MSEPQRGRPAPGRARERLGAELRRIRTAARLTQRQLHGDAGSGHASNVENGHTQPSWDFIERYLELGGDARHVRSLYELARAESDTRRAGVRRRARPQSVRLTAAPASADGVDFDDVRKHYVVQERHESYVFGPDGVVAAVDCVSVVRAVSEGTVLVGTVHAYDAEPRPGVLRVEAVDGCALDRVDSAPTGSVRAYLRLDHAIGPDDDPVRLSFRVHVDSTTRTRPIVMCHPGPGTERLQVDVRFTEPSLPGVVWAFATDNALDATLPAAEDVLPESPDHRYGASFADLLPSWNYGIAWSWR